MAASLPRYLARACHSYTRASFPFSWLGASRHAAERDYVFLWRKLSERSVRGGLARKGISRDRTGGTYACHDQVVVSRRISSRGKGALPRWDVRWVTVTELLSVICFREGSKERERLVRRSVCRMCAVCTYNHGMERQCGWSFTNGGT